MTEVTVTEIPSTEPSFPDILATVEKIYVSAFTETLLPLVFETAGFEPKGHLSATATATKVGLNITLGFHYDNQHPDIMETAQRYIFNAILAEYVANFERLRGK